MIQNRGRNPFVALFAQIFDLFGKFGYFTMGRAQQSNRPANGFYRAGREAAHT